MFIMNTSRKTVICLFLATIILKTEAIVTGLRKSESLSVCYLRQLLSPCNVLQCYTAVLENAWLYFIYKL